MAWVFAGLCLALLAYVLWRSHAAWVRPWRHLEQIVDDIRQVRAPRTFLVDGNPTARRIGIALEDVLLRERELASRAREGELNVRTILGAIRDGLAVVDHHGRVQLLNPAVCGMFGISDTRAGQMPLEVFRDGLVAQTIGQAIHSGKPTQQSLTIHNQRQIAITALPMEGDTGSGAVVLFQDMTQLQQLERVRREFVSNVSHELRTPLSIFRGYLETLIEEPQLEPEERHRILGVLAKHSARLNSLVNDLLSLARLEAPDPDLHITSVSLSELLHRIVHDWKASTKELHFVLAAPENLPVIYADEKRLEQVIYNLLDNAVKYSRSGGEIRMVAEAAGSDAVAVSVIDRGSGIAASDLPRIFERFYRADKARSRELGGTGLGLAIVKHIVQLHGGGVMAESEIGRGTTIRVVLPLGREPERSSDGDGHGVPKSTPTEISG